MPNTSIRFWRVSAPGNDKGTFFWRKRDVQSASSTLRRMSVEPIIAEFWLDMLNKEEVCRALNTWPKR